MGLFLDELIPGPSFSLQRLLYNYFAADFPWLSSSISFQGRQEGSISTVLFSEQDVHILLPAMNALINTQITTSFPQNYNLLPCRRICAVTERNKNDGWLRENKFWIGSHHKATDLSASGERRHTFYGLEKWFASEKRLWDCKNWDSVRALLSFHYIWHWELDSQGTLKRISQQLHLNVHTIALDNPTSGHC